MSSPGILYVTMQPKPGLNPDQFHEWYNNEHGPTRLRLPEIFTNGLRFAATDGAEPHFLAVYDVTSMSHLLTPTYTALRGNRSPREAETIGQVDVKRYFYDLILKKQSPLFLPIEQLTDDEAKGIQLVAVQKTLKSNVEGSEDEYRKWYEEEHVEMLSKVPGWLRTRWFRTSSAEGAGAPVSYLGLHEYAKFNGLGGPEHRAATSTKWRNEIAASLVATHVRRAYSLFYVFGPAPRDLSSLSRLPTSTPVFTSADGKTRTVPAAAAESLLESYVTNQSDGLEIPYVLEGNPADDAPTVALVNSLLTSLRMWDPFVALLKKARPDLRILRYEHRGRKGIPQPPAPATPDMLAADLAAVLDALRIPKLHAVIGVSMGGVTTLNFAINYPDRLEKFVACDFNVTSSAANTAAWKERIAVAESDGGKGIKMLAGQTVKRWFHPNTVAQKVEVVEWMEGIVAGNSIEGFRYGCQALWDYDLKAGMGGCQVDGLLVVGEGDAGGALVKAMDGFRGLLGDGNVELRKVPNTGHLPMSEDPEAFWDAVKDFL